MTHSAISRDEQTAILTLLALDGVGSATVLRLVEELGSVEAVFEASETRLRAVPRLPLPVIARIKAADRSVGRQQLEKAEAAGAVVVTYWDENYPPRLKELESDAPVVLFVRGTLPPEGLRLAVVGTRSATAYGRRMVRELILGLRNHNVRIVSGLASGIDGGAHEAALEAGLPTEAVFGCGVDVIYPTINTSLANRILAAGGALVSEFPMGAAPERHHFPQRNRIIAGLSHAAMVVEAGDKSGALITAMLAAEYGREVLAVPGAVTNPKSTGCHGLIKSGAALVEKSEDILQALSPRAAAVARETLVQMPLSLAEPESNLVKVLDPTEAQHVDEIAARLGLPVGEALGQLLLLELKGAVKQLPGKYFVRA
jgi:DNA processing protein